MANSIALEKGLAQAIKVIAGTRIDNAKRDKTVRATVNRCVRDNLYDIIYNGGHVYAYAEGGAVYMPNSSIYMLIPKGDLSNKKTIVGLTSSSQEREDVVTVASALADYSVLSENLLGSSLKDSVITLETYNKEQVLEFQDIKTLYEVSSDNWDASNNWFNLSPKAVSIYKDQATALLLSAEFKTSLAREQINSNNVSGNYGLILTYKTKSAGVTYNTINEQWLIIEPTTKIALENTSTDTVVYKRLNDFKLEKEFNLTSEENQKTAFEKLTLVQGKIQITKDALDAFILESSKTLSEEAISFCNLYSNQLQQLTEYTVNNNNEVLTIEELKQLYVDWFNTEIQSNEQVKILRYDFDINQMVEDPYRFNTGWFYQYCIIPIEDIGFDSIQGLYFFCQDFNPVFSDKNAGKIKMRLPQLFFLSSLGEINGDYEIKLNFPDGRIFYTTSSGEQLTVEGRMLYQRQQDITSTANIAWFKQDLSVTNSDHPNYNTWAGIGWKQISNGKDSTTSRSFTAAENKAYENNYMCIGMRGADTVVKSYFTLYNEANHKKIEIVSDSGFSFDQVEQDKILTCKIDDKTENFDTLYPDSAFRFTWSSQSELFSNTYIRTEEEIKELLNDESVDYTTKTNLRVELAAIAGITWNRNILTFPSTQISNEYPVTIICSVELTEDGVNYFKIGEASIVLTEQEIGVLRSYRINIINGNQVFQYNEAGVSPASERYNQPYEIKPLSCEFYSPSGILVDPSKYTIQWQYPKENSLIVPDIVLNEEYIYDSPICTFGIVEDYNFDALENQIVCIITFDGAKYYQQTNFFFGKIGENGTNATDIVAKISPLGNTTSTILKDEPLTLHVFSDGEDNYIYRWNSGEYNTDASIKLELYRRNVLIDPVEYQAVKWSIAGNTPTFKSAMKVESSILDNDSSAVAYINYDYSVADQLFTNYIIKGEAALDLEDAAGESYQQKYYAFYPVCVIVHNIENIVYSIGVDKSQSLRQVMYTADGRAPQYSRKQGIKLNFGNLSADASPRRIKWSVCGGVNYTEQNGKILSTEGEYSSFLSIIDPDSGNLVKTCETRYSSADQIALQTEILEKTKQQIIDNWKVSSRNYMQDYNVAEDKAIIESQYKEALNDYILNINNINAQIQVEQNNVVDFIQIQAQDAYDGETSNHYVKIEIYEESTDVLEYIIYAPIHLYLNQYGLSSVNAWDGNSIEINDEGKYVFAPQIGAGQKNKDDNTFTGLVMGKAKTYQQDNSTKTDIGLLGYNHGKQSIWLDAETGNAIFGLPEDDAVDSGNPLTEGRIELVPGGTSRISRWRFDSRSLYRVISKNQTDCLDTGLKVNRIYTQQNYGHDIGEERNFETLAEPYKNASKIHVWQGVEEDPGGNAAQDNLGNWRYDNGRGELVGGGVDLVIPTTEAAAPINAHGSVPHDQQGMLLSAAPTYLSVKGKPFKPPKDGFTINEDGIDFNDPNTIIRPGDSLEVQINPNSRSVFTIFAHMNPDSHYVMNSDGKYVDENGEVLEDQEDESLRVKESNEWYRIPRVGIDASGRFYTNAIKDKSVSMIVGDLGAFGAPASTHRYTGAQFEVGEGNDTYPLVKFFTAILNKTSEMKVSPLFISSHDQNTEGIRPIGIYGNNYINIFSGDNKDKIEPETDISALRLNDKINTILLGTTSSEADEGRIDGSFDEEKTPEKAELKLTYQTGNEGHLVHTRNWRTHIVGSYIGTYKNTYEQTIDKKASYIFNNDIEGTIIGNKNWHLSPDNSDKKINIDFSQRYQTLEIQQRILNFNQYSSNNSERAYVNNLKIDSSNSGGFTLSNAVNDGSINILQRTVDSEEFYSSGDPITARIGAQRPSVLIASRGTAHGIGLYTADKLNDNESLEDWVDKEDKYVSFTMIPGVNGAFYMNATAAPVTMSAPQSQYYDKIDPPVYDKTKLGTYFHSEYLTNMKGDKKGLFAIINDPISGASASENQNMYPLTGVTIGPTTFTKAIWANGVFGLTEHIDKKWAAWPDRTSIYAEYDIRTGKDLVANGQVCVGVNGKKNSEGNIILYSDGNATFKQRVTAGAFTGDGKKVTYTSDGDNVSPSLSLSFSNGAIQLSGTIVSVSHSNGRPSFSGTSVSTSSGSLANYINGLIDAKLKDYVTKDTYNKHRHNIIVYRTSVLNSATGSNGNYTFGNTNVVESIKNAETETPK